MTVVMDSHDVVLIQIRTGVRDGDAKNNVKEIQNPIWSVEPSACKEETDANAAKSFSSATRSSEKKNPVTRNSEAKHVLLMS